MLILALALPMVLTQCGENAPSYFIDSAKTTFRSVDPGHVLVYGGPGAASGAVLWINYGELETPDWDVAWSEPLEASGAFRFVLDLAPGSPVTIWAASSEQQDAELSSPRIFSSDPSDLPAIEEGGTTPGTPGINPTAITLELLDDHHALVIGAPGAASGLKIMSVEAQEGAEPNFEAARDRTLGKDGSFRFVSDLYPGFDLHLRAVGPEGTYAETSFQRP